MSSFQYTACCRRCSGVRALVRAEILTGRNPVCDTPGCGEAMVVYSGTGRMPSDDPEMRIRGNEGS